MPAWLLLMAHSLQPLLYAGLVFTVPLTLASFAIGIVVAFIVALVRLFGPRWAVACVRFYVWLFRGSPLLVQLFVIFYGLPNVGIVLDPLTAAIIGFSLNVGRVQLGSDTRRDRVDPKGAVGGGVLDGDDALSRRCAARSCRKRRASRCPPLSNSFIALVKDTSLAAVLTVPEVFQAAQRIAVGDL